MSEVHLTESGTEAVLLQCLPGNWGTGELLTTNGDRNRKYQADEYREQLGDGNPLLAKLIQKIRPQEPRFLVINLGVTPSAIDLQVATHSSEPPMDLADWETIEQAGVEIGDLPAMFTLRAQGNEHPAPALDEVLKAITNGWNMVRAKRRGYQPGKGGAEFRIDIWPIDRPTDLQRIKHQPGKPERPRVGPGADAYEQWVRITMCLIRAGVGTTADTGPRGQTSPLHSRVRDAITDAGLPPKTLPLFWFNLLTEYPDDRWTTLIPGYDLLTIEQSFDVRQRTLNAWVGIGADYPSQAGEPAYTYIPEYIPLAERDAYLLVYDARPGPQHGMILEFEKVDADDDTTRWKSLTHFLGDLAFALENRTPFLSHTPNFDDNTLSWMISPETTERP